MMSSNSDLDYRPYNAEILGTAGDSLGFRVILDDVTNIPNPVWSGQVRDAEGNNPHDFDVQPEAKGCLFYLSPATTRALSQLPGSRRVQTVVGVGRDVMLWQGEFDVQVAYDVGMVRTLIRGTVKLDMDVTQ